MIRFLEWLNERIITEMAFKKRVIEEKIRGLENPINLHLIKIYRYEDGDNLNKHKKDVLNWLSQIQKLDYNKAGRKMSKEFYFNLLFSEPITDKNNVGYLNSVEKGELKNYQNLPKIRTPEEILEKLYQIHQEIAKRLSEDDIWDLEL